MASRSRPTVRVAPGKPAPSIPLAPPSNGGAPEGRKRRARRRRGRRRLGRVLILTGVLVLAYGAATVVWRDPVTDLYTRWQQQRLASELAASIASFEESEAEFAGQRAGAVEAIDAAEQRRRLIATAKRFDRHLKVGQPLGRIIAPRLHLNKVFIHGTRWREDLSRGPGHYVQTGIPAIGQTVAVAGHRTTFGAPFRRIDKLRDGDEITLVLPYGTFHYVVFKHRIVDNGDWSILKPLGFDALLLTACHPLYSAAQRWVAYARLSWVKTMDGARISLWHPRQKTAASA